MRLVVIFKTGSLNEQANQAVRKMIDGFTSQLEWNGVRILLKPDEQKFTFNRSAEDVRRTSRNLDNQTETLKESIPSLIVNQTIITVGNRLRHVISFDM